MLERVLDLVERGVENELLERVLLRWIALVRVLLERVLLLGLTRLTGKVALDELERTERVDPLDLTLRVERTAPD